MNVLIVKFAALGDVLRTTSLLGPIRRRYPSSRIFWLTSPQAKPLLLGHPLLSGIIGERDISKRFDLVLSLEETRKAALLARQACRGRLVGVYFAAGRLRYSASSAPYYDMSLLNTGGRGGLEQANALKAANTDSYARIWLKIIGLPIPRDPRALRPRLYLDSQDRAAAAAIAPSRKFVALNPGAGRRWPAKQLSIEKAAGLLAALHGRFGRPLMLLGGKEESVRNRRILKLAAALCPQAEIIYPGVMDLRSFAATLELCETLVTTDSLAFHLATALGIKTVVLVGPTSASELETFGRGFKLEPPNGCDCFYRSHCRRSVGCLDQIPEGLLLERVEKCLS